MGYADKIGEAQPRPTVGDLLKARTSRQVRAEAWAKDNPAQAHLLGPLIAVWIETGRGAPPWEKPPAGDVSKYPPIRETESEL
jgi:hypothetical protein